MSFDQERWSWEGLGATTDWRFDYFGLVDWLVLLDRKCFVIATYRLVNDTQ